MPAIHLTRRSIGMHSVGASLAQMLAQVLWSSHIARARAAAAPVLCAVPPLLATTAESACDIRPCLLRRHLPTR